MYILKDITSEINKICDDEAPDHCQSLLEMNTVMKDRVDIVREQIKGVTEKVIKMEKMDADMLKLNQGLDEMDKMFKLNEDQGAAGHSDEISEE